VDQINGRLHTETEHVQHIGGDHLSLCRFEEKDDGQVQNAVSSEIKFLFDAKPKLIGKLLLVLRFLSFEYDPPRPRVAPRTPYEWDFLCRDESRDEPLADSTYPII